MAKEARTIRLEVASALLALEAKLDEGANTRRLHHVGAIEALGLIRKAHDALLK